MNNTIKLTWRNLILCIIIFYIIGDIMLGIRIFINQRIDDYKKEQQLIEMKRIDEEFRLKWEKDNKELKKRLDSLDSVYNNF
jgi:hypothetical protein